MFSGLVIACRFATCPTGLSPLSVKPTTDAVRRFPSALVITLGSPPSMTATTEFVVPRSIPMMRLILPPRGERFRPGSEPRAWEESSLLHRGF